MLPNYYIATLRTNLQAGGSETELDISTITTPDGHVLTIADFAQLGNTVNLAIDPQSQATVEYCKATSITPTGPSFLGLTRGYGFADNTQYTANKLYHPVGATVIITWGTHDIQNFIDEYTAQAITGVKTFTVPPIVPTPVSSTQAANKAYVDSVAIAGAPNASATVKGITELSVNPASPTVPIALSANDPKIVNTKSGTPLDGSVNKIVDTASIGTAANDIVQLDSLGRLPIVDGSQLFNVPSQTVAATAANELLQGDEAYFSSAGFVKRYQPNGYGTASVGTSLGTQYAQLYNVDSTHVLALSNGTQPPYTSGTLTAGYYALNVGEIDMTATIANASLSLTSVTQFQAAQINGGSTFILAYGNASTNLAVLTIGASSFSLGTLSQIDSGNGGHLAVDMIDATHGIVAWTRASDGAICVNVFTVSGTAITLGATVVTGINVGNTPWVRDIKVLSASLVVISTITTSTTFNHYVTPISIVSNAVGTIGTPNIAPSNYTNLGFQTSAGAALRRLSATKFLLITSSGSGSTYGNSSTYVSVGLVTGTTVSYGSPVMTLSSTNEGYINTFANAAPIVINSTTGFALMFSVANGTTVTYNVLFFEIDSVSMGLTLMQSVQTPLSTSSSTQFASVCLAKIKPGKYVYYNSVAQGWTILSLTFPTAAGPRVGVSTQNFAENATATIALKNFATGPIYSGLSFGSQYYIDNNGQPTLLFSTVNNATPMYGQPLSNTQMLLQ